MPDSGGAAWQVTPERIAELIANEPDGPGNGPWTAARIAERFDVAVPAVVDALAHAAHRGWVKPFDSPIAGRVIYRATLRGAAAVL